MVGGGEILINDARTPSALPRSTLISREERQDEPWDGGACTFYIKNEIVADEYHAPPVAALVSRNRGGNDSDNNRARERVIPSVRSDVR